MQEHTKAEEWKKAAEEAAPIYAASLSTNDELTQFTTAPDEEISHPKSSGMTLIQHLENVKDKKLFLRLFKP